MYRRKGKVNAQGNVNSNSKIRMNANINITNRAGDEGNVCGKVLPHSMSNNMWWRGGQRRLSQTGGNKKYIHLDIRCI